MALVAAFALGAGVMGTLTWVENRDRATSTTVSATPVAPASQGAPSMDSMAVADAASRAKAAQAAAGSAEAASGPNMGGPNTGNANSGVEQPPPSLTQGLTGPQATVTVANWYYDHERWPQAIELYRATVAAGLDNPNVRTDLGNALRFNGQPQEALTQYQVAQRQDPKHEQSLFNQGGLYAFALNEPKKAVEAWRAYLKRFPNGTTANEARQFIQKFSGNAAKPKKK